MHFSERYATAHKSRVTRVKRKTIISVVIVLVCIAGAVGSLWIPWWRVKTIIVDGPVDHEEVTRITESLIRQRKALIIPEDNYFFIPQQQIEATFADQMIGVAFVEQTFPDRMRIFFPQWKPVPVVCIDPHCFYANTDGMIFTKAPAVSEGLLPVLMLSHGADAVGERPRLGSSLISSDDVDFLTHIVKSLRSRGVALDRIDASLPGAGEMLSRTEYTLYTKEGWRLLLDSSRDRAQTAEDLIQLLDQKIKNRSGLGYIDLRFTNKAFFKYGADQPLVPVLNTDEGEATSTPMSPIATSSTPAQ